MKPDHDPANTRWVSGVGWPATRADTVRAVSQRVRTTPIREYEPDAVGRQFLADQAAVEHSRARWVARSLLRPFLGDFALNGLLGTYPLFLLSTTQWRSLLGDAVGGRLLDVGAACGDVTDRLAPLFDSVTVTEVNRPMARTLQRRGYDTHRVDLTVVDVPGGPFDVVAALNVLDRCSHPRTLLGRLVEFTAPGGHLVVSVPLPYRPCWYDGPRLAEPLERLPLSADRFDTASRALASALETQGTEVTAIAKAPYLSGGDRDAVTYERDTAIVVARRPGPLR